MILEIRHETQFEYSLPVIELIAEVRLEPNSDENQSVRSFHLAVSPAAETFRFYDGFSNRVHHFNLMPSCKEIRVTASSIVESHPRQTGLSQSQSTYPLVADEIDLAARSFMSFKGPVRKSPQLDVLLETLRPVNGTPLGQLTTCISAYISTHFEYAKDVTLASSPVDDVLRERKGVCQDFTHLMIALIRSFGVPARYVSGYVHRPNKESQSHAWCEVWLPDVGWCGIDPTNNREIDDHFVKVAIGRDFTDVPPNKGVYRGKADEKISVRVETRALDRLPALAWQEKLPSFEVPLVRVANRMNGHDSDPYAAQQHQQ